MPLQTQTHVGDPKLGHNIERLEGKQGRAIPPKVVLSSVDMCSQGLSGLLSQSSTIFPARPCASADAIWPMPTWL